MSSPSGGHVPQSTRRAVQPCRSVASPDETSCRDLGRCLFGPRGRGRPNSAELLVTRQVVPVALYLSNLHRAATSGSESMDYNARIELDSRDFDEAPVDALMDVVAEYSGTVARAVHGGRAELIFTVPADTFRQAV